jgi:hypothetical protein
VKALITCNWSDYVVEATAAEIETFMGVMGKMRKVMDDARSDEGRAISHTAERPDLRVALLPGFTTITIHTPGE